jgi:hypothetical protein
MREKIGTLKMKHYIQTALIASVLSASAATAFASDAPGSSKFRVRAADGAECQVDKSVQSWVSADAELEAPSAKYNQDGMKLNFSFTRVLKDDADQSIKTCEALAQQDALMRDAAITQANLENESLRMQLEQMKAQLEMQKKQQEELTSMSSDW